jgi:drug/metabolite transporter (DMT)-like permease
MGLSPKAEVIASVISYSLCSGSLVLVNKLILHYLPFPSLVIVIQLLSSIFLIYGSNFFGVMSIDELKWEFARPYCIYTVAFSTGVYANMMCLNASNVETVIVARSLSPLLVSVCDFMFLGRELPSKRSTTALCVIFAGAMGYARTDEQFISQGFSAYFWPFAYLCLITFEMVYGKQIVRSVKFKTVSGPVQYTNLLGWPPMLLFAKMGGEFQRLNDLMSSYDVSSIWGLMTKLPTESVALCVLGCLIGTGIGYSGWWCRGKVSATSFTLIGVLNKCLTVIANTLIWDNHASPAGIASLFLCLIGGSFYQQAPMRKRDKDESCSSNDKQDVEMATYDDQGLTKRGIEADDNDGDDNMQRPLIQKK